MKKINILSYFDNKNILITGASGFIGGRLTQIFSEHTSAKITALVNNYSNAIRLVRYPIDVVKCDISSTEQVAKLRSDYDYVFHFAYGNTGNKKKQISVNVDGTINLLEHFKNSFLKKFVFASTMLVYGIKEEGLIDESLPYSYSKNTYADSKIIAEKKVFDFHQKYGFPSVVIQPSAVYGPWAPSYTIAPIKQVSNNKILIPNYGMGVLNLVYIDDLIQGILLAVISEKSIGEKYLISSGSVTYKEFYSRFENELGRRAVQYLNIDEIYEILKIQKKNSSDLRLIKSFLFSRNTLEFLNNLKILRPIKRSIKFIIPQENIEHVKLRFFSNSVSNNDSEEYPLILNSKFEYRFMNALGEISIKKAINELGYVPSFDFKKGIESTFQWAKWARLL